MDSHLQTKPQKSKIPYRCFRTQLKKFSLISHQWTFRHPPRKPRLPRTQPQESTVGQKAETRQMLNRTPRLMKSPKTLPRTCKNIGRSGSSLENSPENRTQKTMTRLKPRIVSMSQTASTPRTQREMANQRLMQTTNRKQQYKLRKG